MTAQVGAGMAAVPAGVAPAWWRLPFLAAGFASLLAGLHAGLARLGWDLPVPAAELAAAHGALMVSGFFGTLISLERAVALGRPWAYLAPAAAGLGGLSLLAGAPWPATPLLFVTAAAALFAVSLQVIKRQATLFTLVLAGGAAAWFAGNALWLNGAALPDIVPWWALFFLLTIAGERLELTRLMPVRADAPLLFVGVLGLLVLGSIGAAAGGARMLGIAWLVLAAWLAVYDIARRTVHGQGLPRFTAVCLLSGYAWLGIAGAALALGGMDPGRATYDAALHALFLGFVFAMVFGHAPIIFPAILRRAIPFDRMAYLPLFLLNLSLVLRLAGDATGSEPLRQWGGLGNALTVLVFLGLMGRALLSKPGSAPARW